MAAAIDVAQREHRAQARFGGGLAVEQQPVVVTGLQGRFVGGADNDFASVAADGCVGFRDQDTQHLIVEQRLYFRTALGDQQCCAGGVGRYSIALCQRYTPGVAGFWLVGENPVALSIDIHEDLCQGGLGDQAGDQ
ncbi:hypothetical protein D3C86_1729660 [compost metagenome]